jgi:hypothetical protein
MLYTSSKAERWKLFSGYASRLMTQNPAFTFDREEWVDFLYLKYYFSEDFLRKKLRPWLPSIFDEVTASEGTTK